MQKLDLQTANFTDENIEKLAAMFPHCVTEIKDEGVRVKDEGARMKDEGSSEAHSSKLRFAIDFDLLKQELSANIVDGQRERYQINWPGKRQALITANTPINKTLRPCREESVDFDSTQNLYIEGDNLEALKLLQESYLGKVKMIYIDPPYNTGKDFVYKDNFTADKAEYELDSEQRDEDGGRLVTNPETNGRYHSDWLSMMYPRLKLARNLLKDDGVIFISIDDNEVHNLRKVCDEVFGVDNFIGEVCWKNKYGAGAKTKGFIEVHEYILCYSKLEILNISSRLSDEQMKTYNKKDDKFSLRGGYVTQPIMTASLDDRKNLQYPIEYNGQLIHPRKQWVWAKARLESAVDDDEIVFKLKKDGQYSVRAKVYLKDKNGKVRKGKPLSLLNGPFNQEGTKIVKELLGENIFSFPKPLGLIQYFLDFTINDNEDKGGIYLDFFCGSGSSAHAVMQLNAEDGGQRKFIMVQLPEAIDEKSEAHKAGYSTIAEISKERIRRAGARIKDELGRRKGEKEEGERQKAENTEIHPSALSPHPSSLDTGFRVLKIDSSNMNDVYYSPDELTQGSLQFAEQNIKADRTAEDLLFQVLLDWGVDLTLPISREIIKVEKDEGDTKGGRRKDKGGNAEIHPSSFSPHPSKRLLPFKEYEVFFVDDNALAACFDDGVDEALVKALAKREMMRVVFKDTGFAKDEIKDNVEQIFKQLSPETEVRAI